MSIRNKLLIALLVFSGFAACIGAYAIFEIKNTVSMTVQTYNKPFMSINFSRSALNAFANMEKAVGRSQLSRSAPDHEDWNAKVDDLYELFREDMAIAIARSPSPRATAAMNAVMEEVHAWNALRRDVTVDGIDPAEWRRLDDASTAIFKEFDFIADQIAGDGFILRQNAIDSIESLRNYAAVVVILIVVAAVAIATLLGRAISRPLRQAVTAAERISQGELTTDIPNVGSGEMRVLLASLSRMQRNLRTIMAREEELRKSAQLRLADAIENSPEGIVLLDSGYRVVLANSQMLDFFSRVSDCFSAEADFFLALTEATRQHLMGKSDRAELERCCRDASVSGQALTDIRMANGGWLRFQFGRARDHGIVVICTDISDIIRREEQFRAAMEEAEAANRAKTEFLANMSHELRTPLNAVIGFSQMLKDEILGPVGSPQYRDYASDIHDSGTHLLSIINDILDLSKIEAGKMALDLREVDPCHCVESSIRILRPRAADRDVAVSWRTSGDVGTIFADERMLKQILMNLLSNAIKFTASGGKVEIDSSVGDDGMLHIDVCDTGIGMSQDEIRIASEPFGQVDSSLGRKYEGTGLGLPLARRMAELHGGYLRIASQPGVGTTVTLAFPLATGNAVSGARPQGISAAG